MINNTTSKILIGLLSLLLLLPFSSGAQELTHIPGQILIQPSIGSSMSKFVAEASPFVLTKLEPQLICREPFQVWLIQTDAALQNEYRLLNQLRDLASVEQAQFNIIVKDRISPNDPQFGNQWHYINPGTAGGQLNADLDANLAWDITTGGLTQDGDTIVVCMIEEGIDVDHEDLASNMWYNHAEIPDNNIDDDNNGYIDDFKGWNIVAQNDDLENGPNAGWHGTSVAGIIGAKGNNALGVAGVNWDVKIMNVIRGNTMDQILSAYAYPYTFRKKFNETDGEEGAFVVATNSSWGIDFGLPEEAPLWCSFYDSLGTVGVLNSAATANGNYNVDQVGDLPTACPSDYLISVTNLDNADQKHPNAAYGDEQIDLGAYGTNIWTTKKNNTYGAFTGTSAASPSVAGAIALLYAAPCPNISWFAKQNPKATAQLIRYYILEGATPNSDLSNNTLTGGRLNLNNALDLLMQDCSYTDCFPPIQIESDLIDENTAEVSWLSAANANSVDFRYRIAGNSTWWVFNNVTSPVTLPNLELCTEYEYQLKSYCDFDESNYTTIDFFKTGGCCKPPDTVAIEYLTNNSVQISWESSSAINSYNIRYRAIGNSNWIEQSITASSIVLSDLEICSSYEIEIRSFCNNTITLFSDAFIWDTQFCDKCLEFEYCEASAAQDHITWISNISFNEIENSSGGGTDGYSDFTGLSTQLVPGFFYDLSIETDFDFLQIPLFFQVWIDLNQNGIFENEELLLESEEASQSCQESIYIPSGTINGTTRMRIAALEFPEEPCAESEVIGEIEDYCINIIENTLCLPPQSISNLVGKGYASISWLSNLDYDGFEIFYKAINQPDWIQIQTSLHQYTLNNLTSCTDYEYKIRSTCDGEHSDFSPTQIITTLGCGACQDLDYCFPNYGQSNFEWISQFKFGDIDQSSNSCPYSDFTNSNTTSVVAQNNYEFEIIPGFSGEVYQEVYTIWIDYNQDGAFNDLSEKAFQTPFATTDQLITGSIHIPFYTLSGSTRMRVSMRYYSAPPSACEAGSFYGETEDYCINIYAASGIDECELPNEPSYFSISDSSVFINWAATDDANSYQLSYRKDQENWKVQTSVDAQNQLDDLTPCTEYQYRIRSICSNGISQYTPIQYFETSCIAASTHTLTHTSKPIVYPNPFSDRILLRVPQNFIHPDQINVYSSIGKLVHAEKNPVFTDQELALNLGSLPSGLYYIQLGDDILKVIKQ